MAGQLNGRALLRSCLLAVAGTALPATAAEQPAVAPVEEAVPATEQDGESEAEAPRYGGGEVLFVEGRLDAIPDSNTIVTKLPLPLLETPASVSVVGASRIAEQGSAVLTEALESVSGVNPIAGNGTFDFFTVRGVDSIAGGLILVDGAREPESSFHQLYNVERVEVLKGPAAFLYGGSPLAGAVNLVRRQPLAADFVRGEAEGGSFGTFGGTADLNLAGEGGRLRFRAAALWRETDGYRDGREGRDLAVNPAITWSPGEATFVNLSLERLELDHRPDAGLPLVFGTAVPDVPLTRSYQSPFDTSEQEVDRVQVDFETRRSETFTLRNKTYYRALDWLSHATAFNGVFPTASGLEVSRSLLSLDDRQEFLGDQLEAVLTLGAGRVRHHLLAGLELARLRDEFTFDVALLPNIDLLAPVETASEPLFPLPGQFRRADTRSLVVAPYVVDQIAVSEAVRLLLGVRFDRIDFEDDTSGLSRTDEELSPMLGLLWAPRPGLSLYANAAEAFAPPSTFAAGEDRVPEESRQVEAGVKARWLGGRLAAQLAFYRLERRNLAIPDDNGVTRQVGDQRSRGAELEIVAEARRRLWVFLAYAYTDAELTEFTERVLVGFFPPMFVTVDRDGNRPAFAPDHLASAWVSREFASGFGVAGGVRYVGEQFIAEDNAFAIDDYVTLGAALSYRRGPWGLRLNLDNLTDEAYLTRGFGATSVTPAPGFAAYAGFEYSR